MSSTTVEQSMSQPAPTRAPYVVRPVQGWSLGDWTELWQSRELIWFFATRELKTRYAQTALGLFWVVVPVIVASGLYSFIFGNIAGLKSGSIPYPLFVFVGMLPWTFFAKAYGQACNCLFANQTLFTKVYFPRLISPLSGVISSLVDYLIGFVVVLLVMFYYGVYPAWTTVFLPLYLVLASMTAFAVGLWFAALSVRYRDMRLAGGLVTHFWFLATPVAWAAAELYSKPSIPNWIKTLCRLNPMTVVVDGSRWCLLGSEQGRPEVLTVASVLLVVVILIPALMYFKRVESTFVDVV